MIIIINIFFWVFYSKETKIKVKKGGGNMGEGNVKRRNDDEGYDEAHHPLDPFFPPFSFIGLLMSHAFHTTHS